MHTVIIGPEMTRNTVFKQFCTGQTKKRNFKIIDNKVANKIYNGTWELVENGKMFYSFGTMSKNRTASLLALILESRKKDQLTFTGISKV